MEMSFGRLFIQFEWAWQHPQKSLAVKEAISGLKALGGKQGKVMVMYKMLNAPKWNKYNIEPFIYFICLAFRV
jgi:hypothetical protein